MFAAGETEQFVEVGIVVDNVYESSLEEFQAELSLPAGSTGVVLGQQSQATATIQDNNGKFLIFMKPKIRRMRIRQISSNLNKGVRELMRLQL